MACLISVMYLPIFQRFYYILYLISVFTVRYYKRQIGKSYLYLFDLDVLNPYVASFAGRCAVCVLIQLLF